MARQSRNVNRRQVNRTVTYFGTNRKPTPAVNTAISANAGAVLRIGHHGGTKGNGTTGILQRTSRTQTNVWDVD
jgi:hypothetical protein